MTFLPESNPFWQLNGGSNTAALFMLALLVLTFGALLKRRTAWWHAIGFGLATTAMFVVSLMFTILSAPETELMDPATPILVVAWAFSAAALAMSFVAAVRTKSLWQVLGYLTGAFLGTGIALDLSYRSYYGSVYATLGNTSYWLAVVTGSIFVLVGTVQGVRIIMRRRDERLQDRAAIPAADLLPSTQHPLGAHEISPKR